MHRNIYLAPDKTIKEREKNRVQKELRKRKERGQILFSRDGKLGKRRDGT